MRSPIASTSDRRPREVARPSLGARLQIQGEQAAVVERQVQVVSVDRRALLLRAGGSAPHLRSVGGAEGGDRRVRGRDDPAFVRDERRRDGADGRAPQDRRRCRIERVNRFPRRNEDAIAVRRDRLVRPQLDAPGLAVHPSGDAPSTMPDCSTRKMREPSTTGAAAGRAEIATAQRTAVGRGCVPGSRCRRESRRRLRFAGRNSHRSGRRLLAGWTSRAIDVMAPIATTAAMANARRSLVRAGGTSYNKVPDRCIGACWCRRTRGGAPDTALSK